MPPFFSFAGLKTGSLRTAAVLLLCTQWQCGGRRQDTGVVTSVGKKHAAEAEGARAGRLRLELTSDRTDLTPGQCANLSLSVLNPQSTPARWDKGWVFEREGAASPLPESFPRSDLALPPGKSTGVVAVRLCHADLLPGTHRYRITAAPASADSPRSNWVALRVLP